MIILALALSSLTPAPAMPAGALITMCEAGISGNASAAAECKAAIDAVAAGLQTDATASGCLIQSAYNASDAVWAYMDWVSENPQDPMADARMSVMAALVAKWPCGWSDGLSG